jgi:hypothetical protein
MDAALRDRFPRVIEMTYLPADDEAALLAERTGIDLANAGRLVEIAERTRSGSGGCVFSAPISTRQLLAAAADFVMAGPASLAFTIGNQFTAEGGPESERASIMSLLVGKFGPLA